MAEHISNSSSIQDIILDTCILQYFNDRNIQNNLKLYLLELIGRGFGLAISDISIQELLTGATIKQESEGTKTLNLFNRYSLVEKILIAAAQLGTLYRQDKIKNESISIPDKIIAATATLNNSLILTADVHDFPRPFFQEAEEKLIMFKKKDKIHMLCLQVLRPNLNYINQRFEERSKG